MLPSADQTPFATGSVPQPAGSSHHLKPGPSDGWRFAHDLDEQELGCEAATIPRCDRDRIPVAPCTDAPVTRTLPHQSPSAMNAESLSFLHDLWGSLRVADAIDVTIFAVILYGGFAWFRQARTRFAMLGVAALVALYALARSLDLTLTLVLFQASITVALLALVVIFQEEIRHAFERLGNPRALRSIPPSDARPWVLDVVACAGKMAHDRTGALIVFKGKDVLDRHIRGGNDLDGRVSQPLLFSIFDSSSPGHDGAVLVDNGWVRRFGVHLPLSTHIAGNENFGTRHTAAIGLTERCDALVVVVSEERGEISVAREGKLNKLSSMSELEKLLLDFLSAVTPKQGSSPWRTWTRNLAPKLLALLIAVVTWVVVVGPQGESVGRSYRVPVTLRQTPSEFMLDQPRPPDVLVTLSATERAFRRLDPASLVITINAADIRPGAQLVRVGQQDLNLPRGITLHRIDPDGISLVAHETMVRDYPIRASTEGKLGDGLKLARIRTEPAEVTLVVRKSAMGTFARVETEPVDLSEVRNTSTLTRGLSIPPGARLETGENPSVRVIVELASSDPK